MDTQQTVKTMNLQKIIRRAAKFSSIDAAWNWASYSEKPAWVVVGDVGQYWVVRPVDAARLERAGYGLA